MTWLQTKVSVTVWLPDAGSDSIGFSFMFAARITAPCVGVLRNRNLPRAQRLVCDATTRAFAGRIWGDDAPSLAARTRLC